MITVGVKFEGSFGRVYHYRYDDKALGPVAVGDVLIVETPHQGMKPVTVAVVDNTPSPWATKEIVGHDPRAKAKRAQALAGIQGRPTMQRKPIHPTGALTAYMAKPVRGDFMIHVNIEAILSNKEKGSHDQVAMVRHIDEVASPVVAREVMWDGPSRFVHHDFQKIPGTNVQNWIETDAPITCVRDEHFMDVMPSRKGDATPMLKHIRGRKVIHVAAPVLMRNRKEGRNDPVIAVRNAETDWDKDVVFCRKVEWSGPARLCHRPTTPIPGTNGRGIAFVETDAVLTLHIDGAPPVVLR